METFATLGYSVFALLIGLLAIFLLSGWQTLAQRLLLFLAVTASSVWAALAALESAGDISGYRWVLAAEVVRNSLWLMFLLRLLRPLSQGNAFYQRTLSLLTVGTAGLAALLLATLFGQGWLNHPWLQIELGGEWLLAGQLVYAVAGLVLVEQLFRNTPHEHRWGMKYLCFGLGVFFIYDFYLYTDALLFHRIDIEIWSARGAVNAMAVPLLALAVQRNPDWNLSLALSRRMVFHSTALFGAGTYMLLMAMAGYYIKLYGGEWGTVLQISFLFAAAILLAAVSFSGSLRSRLRVFLNKHFFSYRYDYREEWLRLMDLLAGGQTQLPLYERVIWAISEIADSPAGVLWLADDKARFHAVAHFNLAEESLPALSANHPLMALMAERQWIVDLRELRSHPERYDGVECPQWPTLEQMPWLLVPLMQEERMLGFVLLTEPRVYQGLNWEALDLLKTAGLQAASYIALHQAADALADARQFEGFNRLSAFVIHDLKNLIAQLSLVAKNAAKHKHNPDFIDDAVHTIENSVDKMNRLMAQLKSADASGKDANKPIELVDELRAVVDARRGAKPQPIFNTETPSAVVRAEEERLGAVFGHVLQNALDATSADGEVSVGLRVAGDQAVIEFSDTGVGMDASFIQSRLFRPFDSTKGLTGMGIGAYECREVVQAAGGQVKVDSEPGKGTVFRIMLPLLKPSLKEESMR